MDQKKKKNYWKLFFFYKIVTSIIMQTCLIMPSENTHQKTQMTLVFSIK